MKGGGHFGPYHFGPYHFGPYHFGFTTSASFLEKILLPLVKTLWPLMKRHCGSSQMTIRNSSKTLRPLQIRLINGIYYS